MNKWKYIKGRFLYLFFATWILVVLLACNQPASLIVYGSNDCHHCTALKKSLDSAEVAYQFFDIDQDAAREMEMVGKLRKFQVKGNIAIPVVDVFGKSLLVGATWQDLTKSLSEHYK